MTSKPPTLRRILLRTLLSWDLFVALGGATALLITLLSSDRPLIDLQPLATAAVPFGIAVGGTAIVSLRWVTDRLKDSAYGELVRNQDPGEQAVSLPFYLIAGVGIFCSLLGVVMIMLAGELSRTPAAWLLSILSLVTIYGILGIASLFSIGLRHQRNSAKMQQVKEETERELREVRRLRANGGTGGNVDPGR